MTASGCSRSSIAQKKLMIRASRKALAIRSELKLGIKDTTSALQIAEHLGVDVMFRDISSMEGMYAKTPRPTVLVSSLRPAGRQAFTVGHELGHHVFGHGEHISELIAESSTARFTPEERLADAFAASILMPKTAVSFAFSKRGIRPDACSAVQMYTVAKAFGVGYDTLITHMHLTLGLLTTNKAADLRRHSPKSIRRRLAGYDIPEDLIPVDQHWGTTRAVEAEVGDLMIVPPGISLEGDCVNFAPHGDSANFVQATQPGIGRLVHEDENWAVFVRVARQRFTGSARYRFLEEVKDDVE